MIADDETERFKTATRKFMKLFNMPREEKLVNRKSYTFAQTKLHFSLIITVHPCLVHINSKLSKPLTIFYGSTALFVANLGKNTGSHPSANQLDISNVYIFLSQLRFGFYKRCFFGNSYILNKSFSSGIFLNFWKIMLLFSFSPPLGV